MRKMLTAVLVLMALAGAAQADAMFYNITNQELKYNIILPNGVKKDEGSSLGVGTSTAGYTSSIIFDYRIKEGVTYEILDDLGNVVAKGPLAVDMTYLVYSEGDQVKVVPSGFNGGDGNIKAAVIANKSGQQGSFDFLGQNGLDAQKGVVLPAAFDTKKPFRYANGEENYTVKFHPAGGGEEAIEQKVSSSGRYFVVHRGSNGKIVLSMLGYIKK